MYLYINVFIYKCIYMSHHCKNISKFFKNVKNVFTGLFCCCCCAYKTIHDCNHNMRHA